MPIKLHRIPAWRFLERWAAKAPDRAFMVSLQSGVSSSYGETWSDVQTWATRLSSSGVSAGTRVATLIGNRPDGVLIWLALSRLGAWEAPLAPSLVGHSLATVCRLVDPEVCIIDDELDENAATIRSACPEARMFSTSALVSQSPGRTEAALPDVPNDDPGEVALLLPTAGVGGTTKIIMMPHGQVALYATSLASALELGPEDRAYVCLPMHHAGARLCQVGAMLVVGGSFALDDAFHASSWLDRINSSASTFGFLLGPMMEFVLSHCRQKAKVTTTLRKVLALPIDKQLGAEFQERTHATLVEVYGHTPAGCITALPYGSAGYGSCGRLLRRWWQARVVNARDEDVAVGTIGELVVRPLVPWTMSRGFWREEAETVARWQNLWYHTGDAVCVDADGYFYFKGRLAGYARVRGENVSLSEVEGAIRMHPDVAQVAVLPVPGEYRAGEDEIKAAVVLKPAARMTPGDLAAHCSRNLASYAVPRYFEILQSLPMTLAGAVDIDALRHVGSSAWDRQSQGAATPAP